MEDTRTLGELLREFVSVLGEYLKQQAADAVDRALSEPLKRAARRVVLLGLAIGFAFAAALMLALAFFNLLVELFGVRSAAYAVAFLVSLIIGALCAWAVGREGGKADGEPKARDRGRDKQALDRDPGEGG